MSDKVRASMYLSRLQDEKLIDTILQLPIYKRSAFIRRACRFAIESPGFDPDAELEIADIDQDEPGLSSGPESDTLDNPLVEDPTGPDTDPVGSPARGTDPVPIDPVSSILRSLRK